MSFKLFHSTLSKNCYLLALLCLCCSACVSHKELLNFSEGRDFAALPDSILNKTPLHLQPDDVLSISVYNGNDLTKEAVAPFNLSGADNKGKEDPLFGRTPVYRVNELGQIDFPVLGKIQVAGKTVSTVQDTLVRRLRAYLRDPIVNIQLANLRVTVMGEVRVPSSFSVGQETLTILEAIGLAGDLTEYAQRDNILVIREQNGKRSFGHINLKSREVFSSPYFYLQQHDVVYVEPSKYKINVVATKSQRTLPWISIGTALVNLVAILILR